MVLPQWICWPGTRVLLALDPVPHKALRMLSWHSQHALQLHVDIHLILPMCKTPGNTSKQGVYKLVKKRTIYPVS